MKTKEQHILVLENIRSTHNVGAIFRTADAAGITKIYLTGITPTPFDRFGRKRRDITKASLGAEDSVDWEYVDSAHTLLPKLQEEGFTIIALEQNQTAEDYKQLKVPKKTAVVVGNEVDGVSKPILEMADHVAEIPMGGQKESLNVSVATGIFLFRLFDK